MNKNLNDAIIGNDKITASFNKHGSLLRLFYPTPDYKNFIGNMEIGLNIYNFFKTGNINESSNRQILLSDEKKNTFCQYFVEDTNILKTEIFNNENKIRIVETDFCYIDENVLSRRIKIKNEADKEIFVNITVDSIVDKSQNKICTYIKNDTIFHYDKDYSMAIFSKDEINEYVSNDDITKVMFKGKKIKRNETQDFEIFIYLNDNKEINLLNQIDTEIVRLLKINPNDKELQTKKYWNRYVKKHIKHRLNKVTNNVQKIYKRSILLFPLLYNLETGALIDGVQSKENDESYFVTPKNMYFNIQGYITLGYVDELQNYINIFLKKVQNKNGSFEKRFYSEGTLALTEKTTIEETAFCILCISEIFDKNRNSEFLKRNLLTMEKASKYLQKLLRKVFDEGIIDENLSLLGLASTFEALSTMLKIYRNVEKEYLTNRLKLEQINKQRKNIEEILPKIRKYILLNYYDTDRKTLIENISNKNIDAITLLSCTIFNIFSPKENMASNTKENIELELKTYSGGYIKNENKLEKDPAPYINLWQALYYLKIKDYTKAIENFEFVVNTANIHGLLPKNISNENFESVNQLGVSWIHGLFIYVLDKFLENNIL